MRYCDAKVENLIVRRFIYPVLFKARAMGVLCKISKKLVSEKLEFLGYAKVKTS